MTDDDERRSDRIKDDVEPWPASPTVDMTSRLLADVATSITSQEAAGRDVLRKTVYVSKTMALTVDCLRVCCEVGVVVELDESGSTLASSEAVGDAAEDVSKPRDVEGL